MTAQLGALRNLVQIVDPQLHAFLEARDCLNYFYCYRWLLIHFKREFAFEEVGHTHAQTTLAWMIIVSCSLLPCRRAA